MGPQLTVQMATLEETKVVIEPKAVGSSSSGSGGKKPTAGGRKAPLTDVQFSAYQVGQKHSGRVISTKQFGVFVDIGETSVLVPRSVLSRGNFEKLGSLATSKFAQDVQVELISVSPQNKTISARYLAPNAALLLDINTVQPSDLRSKLFDATVVSSHEFGIFVELDAFGVEGLVPQSMLPRGDKFKAGASVQVKIEELGVDGKKLVLSMRGVGGALDGAGASAFSSIPNTRWIQGVVQSVTGFGLFVRPAGFDATGLVHNSRVPRDLVSVLKQRSPISSSAAGNKTDIECLFAAGDVIKVRVNSVAAESNRVELSMLPYRASDDDEDDYVVEGRDVEEEDGKFRDDDEVEDEADESYDAEDTLLWWKGEPYVKSALAKASSLDEEEEVIMENSAVVEGTWRRMFEVDMREDQADFSTKMREAEMKELEEEIGELLGLDDEVLESIGTSFGSASFNNRRVGAFVSTSAVPGEWKDAIDFFKEEGSARESKYTLLRKGKASEQSEFEALLRQVEVELEDSQPRQPRVRIGPDAVEMSQAAPEAAAGAPVEV